MYVYTCNTPTKYTPTSVCIALCLSPTTPAAVFGWMCNSSYDCGARQRFARGILPRFGAKDEARACLIHGGDFSTSSPTPSPYKQMWEGPSSSVLRVLPVVMSMREGRRSELVPLLILFLLSFAPLPLKSLKSYIYTVYQSIRILICIYAAPSYSDFTFHPSHFPHEDDDDAFILHVPRTKGASERLNTCL